MTKLLNPGFEKDWGIDENRDCFVFPVDGIPYHTEVGNIFVPHGWYAWYRHGRPADFHDPNNGEGYVQPEVTHMPKSQFPDRVSEGEQSIKLFTFYRCHDAGLLTLVQDVTPGVTYRASAKAHAWSNWQDGPHPDDPFWSEGPGYGAGFAFEGDTDDDAWRNFAFYVGIDPTGGGNPYADSVIWGRGAHIYNKFHAVPAVEAVALAETVTVFLRSVTLWRYKHNDAYWDDVRLTEVGSEPILEYDKYAHLGPQDITGAEFDEIQAVALPRKQSIFLSAHDAFAWNKHINKLTVEVWGVERIAESVDALEEWVYENFPPPADKELGILYSQFSTAPQPSELSLAYPTTHEPPKITGKYNEWRTRSDGTKWQHKGLDLRSSWRVWNDEILCALPGEVIYVGSHPRETGYGYQIKTMAELIDGRKVRVRYAHFVTDGVYVKEGDQVKVGQKLGKPDSTGYSTGDHLHIDVQVNSEYVDPEPLIDFPSGGDEPTYPKPAEFLSLHIQDSSDGDAEYIAEVQPEWVKLVLNMQRGRWVKSLSPNTKVLYRHYTDQYDKYLKHGDGLKAGMRLYLEDAGLDSLKSEADYIDAMEGTNELIGTGNPDDIKFKVEAECWFAYWLNYEMGDAVVPCILNPGVGNPDHGYETQLLIPAAECAIKYNGYLGGHVYIGFRYTDHYCTLDDAAKHFSMRHLLSWDPEFRAVGLYPRYLFTEGGGIYIHPTAGMPSSGAGWKYKETCRGDFDWYLEKRMEFRSRVAAWNKAHGYRARGEMEFTFPGRGKWEYFGLNRGQLEAQAARVT